VSFVHLNVASAYSAHYGVNRPEQLAEAAKSLGFEALAITDRDGLYGAVKHIGAAIKNGLAPIVGANLKVDDSRVTLLALGRNKGSGWSSLCKTISAAHHGSKKKEPRPTFRQWLEAQKNREGAIGATAREIKRGMKLPPARAPFWKWQTFAREMNWDLDVFGTAWEEYKKL
jgi:DNA polymerase III alpha subunit